MLVRRFAGLPMFIWAGLLVILVFIFLLSLGGDSVLSRGSEQTLPVTDVKPLPAAPPGPIETTHSAPSCAPGATISWADAPRYVNQRVTMIGPVSQVTSSENEAQLELGIGPGEHVEVQLLSNALPPRSIPPREVFANKVACVYGVVQRINGVLSVIIDKPADVIVV
jgi:hypothetical protein